MITWKLWWLLVSYLIWHLTTQTVNKSKTKIWPNPLPGWSTFDHIPDHIFLIIHFVCRHFCGPDFTIPISRRNPFSFQKLSPFTYHCFCSNIYMLNFHKMNSYQGNDHLSRNSNTVSICKLLHTWETKPTHCFSSTDRN